MLMFSSGGVDERAARWPDPPVLFFASAEQHGALHSVLQLGTLPGHAYCIICCRPPAKIRWSVCGSECGCAPESAAPKADIFAPVAQCGQVNFNVLMRKSKSSRKLPPWPPRRVLALVAERILTSSAGLRRANALQLPFPARAAAWLAGARNVGNLVQKQCPPWPARTARCDQCAHR